MKGFRVGKNARILDILPQLTVLLQVFRKQLAFVVDSSQILLELDEGGERRFGTVVSLQGLPVRV